MYHKQVFAKVASLGLSAVLVIVALVASALALVQVTTLSSDVATLRAELASTTAFLQGNITETHSSLSSALDAEKKSLAEKIGDFEENVEEIEDTVGTLEKLSRTDPELLQKYSKVFFLNEHYAPERVVEIPAEYGYSSNRSYQIHAGVWPNLKRLLDRAKRDGIELYVFSAYRSFDEQDALKGAYRVTYGAGTANQFSADQGYSEHQLGTTLDFMTTGIGGNLSGFGNTPAYAWLKENAHRWGFTLSYPENNTYYVYEPWHWRYVGEDLAEHLHEEGKYFYDLEQREIDEYLVNIFD